MFPLFAQAAQAAQAAPIESPPAIVEAAQAHDGPKIDGKLDDGVWSRAKAFTTFTQKFPNAGAAPRNPTTVRVLYDRGHIYLGIDCPQADVPVTARMARRDREVEADRVSVALDTKRDGKSAFEFTVNAAGVLSDRLRFNDTEHDEGAWDEVWEGRTHVTAKGWSAEIAIPLRALRFDELPEQQWGIQVRRYTTLHQETDELAFIPRDVAGEVSHYGALKGLHHLRALQSVELRPFVVAKYVDSNATAETLGESAASITGGLDAKWHPTQRLTLDATFNPDFAQVEADKLVFNLSNVEIELPEKRPFFLEGSDTYVTPMRLLYTRRLGRVAPEAPGLGAGERLVSPPTPAHLLGAVKLTGQLSDRSHVATLSVLGGENAVEIANARGDRRQVVLEPLSAYHVVRGKRDLGANAHVGFLFSSATHAEPTSRYARLEDGSSRVACPQGDVTTVGRRCFHDAFVGSLDARWRSEGGMYVASAQVVGTLRQNGPARSERDGTVLTSGDTDVGGLLRVAKEGGKHWIANLEYQGRGRRLDYNDVGFMPRQNLHRVTGFGGYRTLDPWSIILQTESHFEFQADRSLDFLRLNDFYALNTYVQLTNFWETFIEVHYKPPRFDDRELGDGTALERRGLVGAELYIGTDPRKALRVQAFQRTQLLSGGHFIEGDAVIVMRTLPALDLEIGPVWASTSGEPRFAGRDGDRLLFGALHATSIGGTARATYAFTPRLTLQAFAQLQLNAGHYGPFFSFDAAGATAPRVSLTALLPSAAPLENPDFQEAALNVSAVARWEFRLGSTLFLVYSRAQVPTVDLGPGQAARIDFGGIQRAPATNSFLAKLSVFFG